MKKLDFNHDWTVRPLSRAGEACPVTLPHDAMITEPRTADSMGEGNIGWFTGGDYEYKKKFTIPDELKDRKLILEFESVYKNAEVTINGKKAKTRPYGYTQFYIPLNEFLVDGENEITVIAHNSDQPNSRWYSGTGIYRPVWLWEGPKDYIPIRGVRVKTLTIRPKAVVLVTVKATAPGTACIEILKDGACVAKGEAVIGRTLEGCARIEVPNAELWSIENPSLYEVRVTLGGDVAADTFGIRTLTWTPEKGVALNGKHVILKGACIHHDNGVLGACTFPEAEDRRVRLLKKYGYNALRSAHNPASVWLLDACDKYGVLMMDEYVDAWYMHKTKYDYAGEVLANWKDDLAALVEKDYNHPSVIMYSTGNEVAESAQKKGIDLQTQFTSYLHSIDDTRPVSCGINIFFNFLSSVGLGVYSDDKADKLAEEAKKNADTSKPKKKAVGSEFYNMLAVKLGDNFMKLGATIPPCDWKTKGAYAAMDIAGYNYGLYRYKKDLKKYPDRLILGSETFCKDAYSFYEIARRHPRIIGDFVWPGWDYIGETGLGAPEYEAYHDARPETQMTGGNGRLDLSGKPRCEAFYTMVAFDEAKGPFIGVYPPTEKKPVFNGWTMSKALRSWSWSGYAGNNAEVEVYARAASVELFLNGRSLGKKDLKNNCRTAFPVVYENGTLTAVAYAADGSEIGRDTLVSAGDDVVLNARPEIESVKKEGLIYIPLQYTDKDGIWKPLIRRNITIALENAELMGLGSAAAYFEGTYDQTTVPTYFGEALAVIRATGEGPVRAVFTDDVGAEAEVVIPLEA